MIPVVVHDVRDGFNSVAVDLTLNGEEYQKWRRSRESFGQSGMPNAVDPMFGR